MVLEPFPRQALVGSPGGVVSYCSEVYDAKDWKAVAWWLQCYGSLPGLTGPPLTLYIQSGEAVNGPWDTLATRTISALEVYTGVVNNPSSLVRFQIDIQANEVSSVALSVVVRFK